MPPPVPSRPPSKLQPGPSLLLLLPTIFEIVFLGLSHIPKCKWMNDLGPSVPPMPPSKLKFSPLFICSLGSRQKKLDITQSGWLWGCGGSTSSALTISKYGLYIGPKKQLFLQTPKKFMESWPKGGGVNPYGQPDRKISVFFRTPFSDKRNTSASLFYIWKINPCWKMQTVI